MSRAGKAAVIVWWVVAVAWALSLVLQRTIFFGPASCELTAGSSVYGSSEWSWAPPGIACRYDLDPDRLPPFTVPPGPSDSAVPAGLVFSAVAYRLGRHHRESATVSTGSAGARTPSER
jgi:hypothetical protein